MLLNFDHQQLRSSLAVWREALAVGRPAFHGRGAKEQANSLAIIATTCWQAGRLAGCLAVLHSCSCADRDTDAMRTLLQEIEALREWIAEGQCALDMMTESSGKVL